MKESQIERIKATMKTVPCERRNKRVKYTKVFKYKSNAMKPDIPEGQKIGDKKAPRGAGIPRHSKDWHPSKRK